MAKRTRNEADEVRSAGNVIGLVKKVRQEEEKVLASKPYESYELGIFKKGAYWDENREETKIARCVCECDDVPCVCETEYRKDVAVSYNATKEAFRASHIGKLNEHCYFIRLQETNGESRIVMHGRPEAVVELGLITNADLCYGLNVVWTSDETIKKELQNAFNWETGKGFLARANFLMDTLGFLPLSFRSCKDKKTLRSLGESFKNSFCKNELIRLKMDPPDYNLYYVQSLDADADCYSSDYEESEDEEEKDKVIDLCEQQK